MCSLLIFLKKKNPTGSDVNEIRQTLFLFQHSCWCSGESAHSVFIQTDNNKGTSSTSLNNNEVVILCSMGAKH